MQRIEKSGDSDKNTDRPRSVYIATYGCQMNVRDSEVVKGLLLAEGYQFTEDAKTADIVLFNTCSVRQHAEDKVWSEVGRLAKVSPHDLAQKTRQIKAGGTTSPSGRKKIIGLVGCMAENYGREIFRRAPAVDIVCGPSCIDELPKLIDAVSRSQSLKVSSQKIKEKEFLKVGNRVRPDDIYHTGFYEEKNHAYVVISEGCDNYCSYCVVPYVRGHLRHRNYQDIINEMKAAVECGIQNITLLGQNVNSYEADQERIDFVGLLKRASEIKGLVSLSFITSHPKDIKKELFELMAERPVIKKYFHLPVQSGSDRILKLMNRGYTAKKYLEMVDLYRRLVYNGQVSTDVIIGFPTETEKDFSKTLNLMRCVCFDSAYIFKYSPRPHTKAAAMKDDVPLEVKKQRHAELLKVQKVISKSKMEGRG